MGSKIKDLCVHISSGGTPSRKKEEYYKDGQINWIKTKELNDCNIYDSEEKITEEGLKNSSAKIFPINTVVMAMYGATAGKLGIMKKESSTNQACCNMVVNETKCDYRFLFYSLLYSREKLINLASGAAQQNLNLSLIGNFDIDCPTLPEQQKIASILSAFDDKIELNNEMNKTLKEIAQIVFKHWFIDFEFPNENGEPYKSSGGEFEDSELGPIPKGWRVVRLNDVCSKIASGGTPRRKVTEYFNGTHLWIKTKELKDNFIIDTEEKITDDAINNSSAKIFPPYTVVMAIYASPTVGRLGILSKESTFNQATCGMIADENFISYEYLYLYLFNKRNFLNNMAVGSAQQNLNVKKIKELKIIVPPYRLIKKFKNAIKPIFNKLLVNQEQCSYLSQLRDTLLPKLVSGEIRVV